MARVGVVGTGLIGASIGLALGDTARVLGWDPDPISLGQAVELRAVEAASTAEDLLARSDVVFLAAPVASIIEWLRTLETDRLVTDVAGVKGPVVEAARRLAHFVGGHPMAGRESSGPAAASASMFRGASWILTTDGAEPADLNRVATLVEEMGAVPVRLSAAEHDAAVAAVSHVPQVVASALVNLVGADASALALAAGGFRDLTRIALSEPAWWTDLLVANHRDVAGWLRALGADLESWADLIEGRDRRAVAGGLAQARETRRSLTAPVAAIRVLLEDHPGEIARVGNALSSAGADVRDLQLRHATRGGGGVLTLSVRQGDEVALRAALVEDGFRIVD